MSWLSVITREGEEDPERWARSLTAAAITIIGGGFAGVSLNFLRDLDFASLSLRMRVLGLFLSLAVLSLLIFFLAVLLYTLRAHTPDDVVKLSEDERAAIAERVVEELEESKE